MPNHPQDFSNLSGDFRNPEPANLRENNEKKKHMKTIMKLIKNSIGRLPLRSGLFPMLLAFACFVEPTPLPAQGQSLTIVPASPVTGPLICKPGFGPPQCWAQAFDTTNDLAFQGNGFASPAVAKDDIQGYDAIHRPEFANDGSYGNGTSWISDSPNSWLKVDLGRIVLIDHITIGRDRLGGYDDRDPGQFTMAVATADNVYANGDDGNDGAEYTLIFDSASFGFSGVIDGPQTIEARFTPVLARFIKLSVENLGADIDEIEVGGPAYGAQVQPPINADGTSIFNVRRGIVPVKFTLIQSGVPTCTLPPATIVVTRTAGATTGPIDESIYVGAADTGSNFRIDSCQYIYNLSVGALGVGTYRVDIKINNQVVGSAAFKLK